MTNFLVWKTHSSHREGGGEEEKETMVMQWSSLPKELILEIARKLSTVVDFVRLRAVCKPWRAAVRPSDLPPQFPWVMLYYDRYRDTTCSFYSLANNTVYTLSIPEFRGKRYCGGSCDGWLLLVDDGRDGNPHVLSLLQPLTRSHILLPPLEHEMQLTGARLSCSPTSLAACGCCTVLTWNSGFFENLFACQLGSDGRWSHWTTISTPLEYVNDVVVSRDHKNIYAIDRLNIFHLSPKRNTSRVIPLPLPEKLLMTFGLDRPYLYLVESPYRELLLVVCFDFWQRHGPWSMEVYRLEDEGWVKLQGSDTLHGTVLFLSVFQSLSASANDAVAAGGLQHGDPAYIAYCNTVNVFNLKDGSCMGMKHLYHQGNQAERLRTFDTWLIPSLCP